MDLRLLTPALVIALHDQILNPNELAGMAGDKSLDAVLARVENRLHYGLIQDEYDLAASYACVLVVGHIFNDANKRTAFTAANVCLKMNGIDVSTIDKIALADLIIQAAQSKTDEKELAQWLRKQMR